jgi:lipopolysaccharide export system permease protein
MRRIACAAARPPEWSIAIRRTGMKSITWYIGRQVFAVTLLAAFVLCFMVWLFRSLDAVDMMLNRGLPVSSFLHFASLQLPRFVLFVSPMATFGAAVFTYNKMIMDSEMIVLRAAGLSPIALAKPVVIVGILVSAVSYYMSLYLVPLTFREYKELEFKYRNDLPKLILQEGVFASPTEGITVYFRDIGKDGEMEDVFIHDNRPNKEPTTYLAERGQLIETEDGRWMVEMSKGGWQVFRKGAKQVCDPAALLRTPSLDCEIPRFESFIIDKARNINVNLKSDEKRSGRNTREYFFGELVNPSTDDEKQLDVLRAELHSRISQPLLPLSCALVGIAILLSGAFNRRGQLKLVLAAIGAAAFIIIASYTLRNYAPKLPIMNLVMYLNALLPMIGALFIMAFPRALPAAAARPTAPT